MPKDKGRSVNPAQEQRRLEKAKAVKKGKAEIQARRNEKLARRNPHRLQRQIDDLKALEESGGIKPREKQILQELEKDIRAVKKARDALGAKAVPYSDQGAQNEGAGGSRQSSSILGKRPWDGERIPRKVRDLDPSSGSETDESVRGIPMPKDTPPPIPRRVKEVKGTGANEETMITNRLETRPSGNVANMSGPVQQQTTYASGPQLRNLQKEAVERFVPSVVQKKQAAVSGAGSLIEPEEFDKLQEDGYRAELIAGGPRGPGSKSAASLVSGSQPYTPAPSPPNEAEIRRLAEEEDNFRNEIQGQMDEVLDEESKKGL